VLERFFFRYTGFGTGYKAIAEMSKLFKEIRLPTIPIGINVTQTAVSFLTAIVRPIAQSI
jgi:hypothetical protein